ncbi:NAD-P-binding protein [Mrakia frigida]|uniref:Gfo/Idh/MocA family protein n=1 Tax=Mrakia frigida TaxID=29902 RepID=UPI003FCC0E85
MSSPSPAKVVRWGIIATGGISKSFSLDLIIDPTTRGVTDVVHEIAAVGSRSVEKAEAFIKENGLGEGKVKACGSYEDVYNDKDVDVIYIGSPHSHHYQNAKDALSAGKHVLCEKAFTVNASQTQALVALAKEKNVFLMEAVWTRFFPVSIAFQKAIQEGKIGEVERVFSDFSQDFDLPNLDPASRLVDPNLAGGALLDLGPYSLNWCLLPIFPHPTPLTLPTIAAQITLDPTSSIDLHTSAILTFPGKPNVQAILSSSLSNQSQQCLIQGSKGEIRIQGPPYRPTGYVIKYKEEGKSEEVVEYPAPEKGSGMFWEADEVARCVLSGKLQSERMTHDSSVKIMQIFDEIRKQGGLVYPEAIEKL